MPTAQQHSIGKPLGISKLKKPRAVRGVSRRHQAPERAITLAAARRPSQVVRFFFDPGKQEVGTVNATLVRIGQGSRVTRSAALPTWETFMRFLESDDLGMVLRCHLALEAALNKVIEIRARPHRESELDRLPFVAKVDVCTRSVPSQCERGGHGCWRTGYAISSRTTSEPRFKMSRPTTLRRRLAGRGAQARSWRASRLSCRAGRTSRCIRRVNCSQRPPRPVNALPSTLASCTSKRGELRACHVRFSGRRMSRSNPRPARTVVYATDHGSGSGSPALTIETGK
jgi:hypothetical protein